MPKACLARDPSTSVRSLPSRRPGCLSDACLSTIQMANQLSDKKGPCMDLCCQALSEQGRQTKRMSCIQILNLSHQRPT